MTIYKSTNPSDNRIFTLDTPLDEVPEGFIELVMVYHVKKVKSKDLTKFDYKIERDGVITRYKFTSETGREAWKKGGRVVRSTSPQAVTCPDCMSELGIETFSLIDQLEAEDETEV